MKHPFYLLLLAFFVFFGNIHAQKESWFYLTARDTTIEVPFNDKTEILTYTGSDAALAQVLGKYSIYDFKKTLKNTQNNTRNRTFFVRANSEKLLGDLLSGMPHLFVAGEKISEENKKIYEPNDYGLTSTIGANLGMQVNLDYLDFLQLPKAWYYTTGNKDFIIGISDGRVDTLDPDFRGKTKMIRNSNLAKGHGISISANAAAQGDNAHGMPGICYDCGIYGTNYGDFSKLNMLTELSAMGVKVINCSWVAPIFKESAQQVVYDMFNNGTIIVAAGGNKSWEETNGKKINYPGAYDKVIAVSSVMYRNEQVRGNINKSKKGAYYASNIEGYLGRSLGFKNNDTLSEPYIYPISTANLNPSIDILAPTAGLLSYGKKVLNDTIYYSQFETTSGATPLVTGAIGLMYSLNPCLPVDEVESILKISSMNIDDIPANKKYAGNYGAGILQVGDAVEMVYQLYTEKETAYIKDQQFSRWDFKITALSKELHIRNQKFTEKATLRVKARNKIVVGPNTILKPNAKGSISLKIDPSLQRQCDLVLRDPTIVND